MGKLVNKFIEGLLITVPAVVSAYVLYAVFIRVDGLLQLPVPGAGFVVTIIMITLIGFLASNFLTKRFFHFFERILVKIPVFNFLYSSLKDLAEAFVGDKKKFDRPVLVTIDPVGGTKTMGFITRDNLEFLGLHGHVAVYLPQAYNFAGNIFIYSAKQVQPLDIDSAEAMAFLVSGGISGCK